MRVVLLIIAVLSACIAQAQSHADCDSAYVLVKKKGYRLLGSAGQGSNNQEATDVPCFMNSESYDQAEINATWIKVEIKAAGWLGFSLTPAVAGDDLDFVVYSLRSLDDCRHKRRVRCMAAGSHDSNSLCYGATGLRQMDTDTLEDAGCSDPLDNNWLAPLKAKAGEVYAILVSNLTGPNGFTIKFEGTAALSGDE